MSAPMADNPTQHADYVRYVNHQRHICGCETRFDTERWRSQITRACDFHAARIDGSGCES